ncbi:hypothetical protein [Rhizobium sp. RU36D]|uniref:hypothetical protein n=1 Tax=Rhizobium sp. RU36D TaxID=1907415 RepID=UPI0009D8C49E|nr:hypothetical protein [Rhizobium sp. RU36D]SMC96830.1 hypothetical protein SAMN05880593_112109 [Rhizobium sp. RU36D]
MRRAKLVAMGLALVLAGCSSMAEKAENAANRSFTSYALGKPYQQVAALGQSPLEQLAGNDRATFGPSIGSTPLADGSVIHRHMAPGAQTETGSDFGGLVGTSRQSTNMRLSYFLVGTDGIVKDWATGSVQGSTSDCISYIGGIINRCTDTRQLEGSLALYDSRVLTRGGQPISSWGTPAQLASLPASTPPMAQGQRPPPRKTP